MNRLSKERRTKIIAALVEGNLLRATARMCNVSFNTVLKLVPEIGRACMEYQDKALRNLTSKRIECDEIWSFCAMLVKMYGNDRESEARYSPAECIGCREIGGYRPSRSQPHLHKPRRATEPNYADGDAPIHSANEWILKVDNHFWAIALHYMHYNFCQIHKTLRVTPAMEAGITDHVWSIEEIADLLESK